MSYATVATHSPASSQGIVPPVPMQVAEPSKPQPSVCRARHTTTKLRIASGEALIAPAGNHCHSYRLAKRAMDLLGAATLLVLLAPVMLTILVVLTITTGGRPLFSQQRAGYLGRPFRMWKFRTMRTGADRMQHTVANEAQGPVFKNRHDPRITRIGRWLRKTSIDEMPQLFQVLTGHMSLVGPRPLPVREIARCQSWQRQRLAVLPGLTCLWQVSGRSEIGFDDWARMDIRYIRSQSLWTDLALLWQTPWTVLSGRGAY